jgi:biotin carboxyl carrier protein
MGRATRYVVTLRGRELGVEVLSIAEGRLLVTVEGSSEPPLEVSLRGDAREAVAMIGPTVLELRANGNEVTVGAERQPVRVDGRELGRRAAGTTAGGSSGVVRAPMPGRVVKVLVEPGTKVEKGAAVVVVEAMKMENELSAPATGVVERVVVTAGDAVERGAALVEIR